MEVLKVQTIKGSYETNVYNVNDFPYDELLFLPTIRSKKKTYYNVSSAFDIETTTIDGIKDDKGKYVKNPYGFMYHWQFCINKKVIFGRTWEEFQTLIKKLVNILDLGLNKNLVVFCHNFSFEFQFIKDFIEGIEIFAREERKVIKCNTSNGIEFRCSYFLSNMSLAKFCENTQNVIHYKLEDTYDYSKLRTPTTPLTLEEKQYCFNDVYGLCECIDEYLKHDTIATLPITNTGFVRREYREEMQANKKNYWKMKDTALTTEQYEMCKRAFRGGNTHANRYVAGAILNDVYSYDISSSYPSSMLLDDYPIGKFCGCTIGNQDKLNYFMKNYAMILEVSFKDITCRYDVPIPYLDIAHCYDMLGVVNDNGRILHADFLTVTLTNIDLDIILKQYNRESFIVVKAMYTTKGKLPYEFRKKTMDFFFRKTTLKGIIDKEYEYLKSKNRLNSSFGMCVTDMVHELITYNQDTFEWNTEKEDIETALARYYNNRNNFLSYQWGVFVTANARKHLQDMIDKVGLDIVYIDTDSIKFQNKKHIGEFEEMNKKIIKQCESNDIPAYVDYNNERVYMQVWDFDGYYNRFKTLGAKKYCFEHMVKEHKEFKITVAGMNKKKGAKVIGKIENFKLDETFFDIGRTTSWYNDEKPHYIEVNGDRFLTASNIGILESTYTLGVTKEYYALIGKNINNLL